MLNSMLQLPGEIEEAAIIQDVPWVKRMTRIIIPIQKTSIISRSKLPQRQEMLDLVRTEMDPDRKNDELRRRWPDAYTNIILKEWYPALRHSDYVVNYTVRSFTTAGRTPRKNLST